MNTKSILCFNLLFIALSGLLRTYAQADLIPLQRWFSQEIDRSVTRDSTNLHIGSKPISLGDLKGMKVQALDRDSTKIYHPFLNYLYRRHLVELNHEKVRLTIDPLVHFAFWQDLADTTAYPDTTNFIQNTRGVKVAGRIGDQFAFETGFYENQAQWPEFMRQQAVSLGVAPGMGRWKDYRFEGFDYSMSYAYLHYQFKKLLRLHAGQGKYFIGHGYRSLILSDAAYNYPFLAATLESPNKKWQYTSRYMALQTLERLPLGEVPEALFKRKAMTMHYLSWAPHSRIEIGLFEGIVWNRYGSQGHHMPSWGAYIPIIGLNTAALGLEKANNVLLGLNARLEIRSDLMWYGQAVLDQSETQGMGYQIGLKWFDVLPRLDIQLEFNSIGQKVYTHNLGLESYSHFNQSLGTPVGPNSEEVLGIVEYQFRRAVLRCKAQQIKRSQATNAPWYVTQYDVHFQPVAQTIWQVDGQIGLRLNVKYNLELLATWTWREDIFNSQTTERQMLKSQVLGISLRSGLQNLYNDF
jgi:hypothetical protein